MRVVGVEEMTAWVAEYEGEAENNQNKRWTDRRVLERGGEIEGNFGRRDLAEREASE